MESNKATVDRERTRGGGEAVFWSIDFHLRALVLLASFPMELQYCRELESDKRSMILAGKLLFIKNVFVFMPK